MIKYTPLSARFLLRNRGVTLIELMVAMAISLIVLLAVGTVYFSTKRTYSVQDEFSRMQESALFAFQSLTQSISTAGFAGCNPVINNILNTTAGNVGLFNYTDGIYGWEYIGTNPGVAYNIASLAPAPAGSAGNWADNTNLALHPNLAGLVLPGTDVLVIKSGRELSNLIPTADIKPGDTSIQFAGPTFMSTGAVLLISDCRKSDLFMNSAAPGDSRLSRDTACGGFQPCNSGANWSHEYKAADVRFIGSTSRAYFIGRGTNGEPALFRYNFNQGFAAVPEELVDGVENMQILYGEDLNGQLSPTRYVTINNVSNLANVVSIRISLLMRSTGELNRPATANTYLLGGTNAATAVSITPIADRRLRKVFTSTIVLRNKLVTGRGSLEVTHMKNNSFHTPLPYQHGAALITSLVILLVLTVLGISAMKSSNLQENIVGNLRDHDLAFQAAETGLRGAEDSLDAIVTIPVPDNSGTNGVFTRNYFYNNFGDMSNAAYNTSVWSSATVYATPLLEVSANPSFVTEFEQKISDDLDPESAAKGKGRYYYRITARGFGSSSNSAVLLQEVYGVRRY